MDDNEDNGRYPPSPYGMNQGYGSSNREKLPVRDTSYSRHVDDQYVEEADNDEDVDEEEEEEEEEEEDDDDDDDDENGVQRIGKDVFEDDDDDDDDYGDSQRHQKKRKLKSLLSSYEFAPRVPPPSTAAATAPKPSFGGRNPLSDWSEHETFILLEAWGDRFVRHGRKSLRSDEWQEVAEKVSQGSKLERTDTQCRNRLDTLKKKFKKEKMKFAENGINTSKWVYFKKMDMLLTSTPQQAGISCGVDSGEYVFMSPKVYLNRANGLDEMRDSPANSGSADGDDDDSEDLPPKRSRNGQSGGRGASFKLIADSIHKFSEVYVKIENSKRQQMLELEKMRMDFHRDLEMQKRQIVERAHAEIARIRQGRDEENDISAENVSG